MHILHGRKVSGQTGAMESLPACYWCSVQLILWGNRRRGPTAPSATSISPPSPMPTLEPSRSSRGRTRRLARRWSWKPDLLCNLPVGKRVLHCDRGVLQRVRRRISRSATRSPPEAALLAPAGVLEHHPCGSRVHAVENQAELGARPARAIAVQVQVLVVSEGVRPRGGEL